MDVEEVHKTLAKAIKTFEGFHWAEEEIRRLQSLGAHIVTIEQQGYPSSLKAIYDPPPFLYIKGEISPRDQLAVAMVGSRAATAYGLRVAFAMARDLAVRGVTIVSGMARGIDSAAHRGALSAGGRTIAVLGCGINVIYPPENRELHEQISRNGAVLTEFPLDTQPEAPHFPARNRIISGLSIGVVIAEAAPRSGSLITARYALEQGREVFAIPGNVESMRSRGTHGLIRQGAHLVEKADDVLQVIEPLARNWGLSPAAAETKAAEGLQDLSREEMHILSTLEEGPLHIDEVTSRCRISISDAAALLLQLELKGLVQQLPGKQFVRRGYP